MPTLLVLVCLTLTSCDSKPRTPVAPPIVWGNGSVTGTIRLIGTPPTMRDIPNRPCHAGAPPLKEENVVVDSSGGLANVFVSIEGVPAGDCSALPAATLDQKDCHFIPHALAVGVGQSVIIRSDDPTMHNVTYSPTNNPPKNFSMVDAGAQSTTTFIAPEYIRVRCDIHPWMNAWVGVFNHPFFAVTASDGAFHIDRIPPGHYTLVAWHEQYGKIEQAITIDAASPVKADLKFVIP